MWDVQVKLGYPKLSSLQRRAADYLLDHADTAGSMTIRECAKGAGVGQPTVLRMLDKCGFAGWTGFLREVWKGLAEEPQNLKRTSVGNGKQQNQQVLQTIQDDIQMISDMTKQLDLVQLAQVVKIIRRAKLIDVYGTDNSANAAAELSGRFLHLGLTSRHYSDLFYQKISAGHLGKKDVAIGFSISGETTAVIEALNSARFSQAVTIAVTGDDTSTLAVEADYVFITPTIYFSEVSKWITSRISQLAFADALCAAIMASDPKWYAKQLSISTKEFTKDISERIR